MRALVSDLAFAPLIDLARDEYHAGRCRAALAMLSSVIATDSPLRATAIVVAGYVHIRLREPIATIELFTPLVLDETLLEREPALVLEARAILASALALVGDHAGAAAMVPDVDATSEESLRSAIVYVSALLRWLRGDRSTITEILADDRHDAPIARARRASLTGWARYELGDIVGFARLQDWAATTMLEAEEGDIGLAAASVRALCAAAGELDPSTGAFERARELYARLPWTADLEPDRFQAQAALAWGHALRGNVLGALSLATEAVRNAPNDPWLVSALVDRAVLRSSFGEVTSAGLDLDTALSLSHRVNWAKVDDEEQLALLVLAEQLAPHDRAEAGIVFARYARLAGDDGMRYRQTGGAWLDALRCESLGVVHAAAGNSKAAMLEISRALETWERLGFRWRAARASLRLYGIDQRPARLSVAAERISAYPHSWIAAELRQLQQRGEPLANRLTPRQREVFHALAQGLSVRDIASRLSLSVNTVRAHRSAIYGVFEVSSQAELAVLARHRVIAFKDV